MPNKSCLGQLHQVSTPLELSANEVLLFLLLGSPQLQLGMERFRAEPDPSVRSHADTLMNSAAGRGHEN